MLTYSGTLFPSGAEGCRARRESESGPRARKDPLSDVPLGEGWWIASDGKWYPASAHPDAIAKQPPSKDLDVPPGEGWWKASDGNWYAPELHPDNIATIAFFNPPSRTVVGPLPMTA